MKSSYSALVLEDYNFWFKPPAGQPEGPPALLDVSFEIEAGVPAEGQTGKKAVAAALFGLNTRTKPNFVEPNPTFALTVNPRPGGPNKDHK